MEKKNIKTKPTIFNIKTFIYLDIKIEKLSVWKGKIRKKKNYQYYYLLLLLLLFCIDTFNIYRYNIL